MITPAMRQRHYVNAAILWLVLTFIAELMVQYLVKFPALFSDDGQVIDDATRLLFVLSMPVFTFVITVMVYSLIHFRATPGVLEAGAPITGNNMFSLGWLAVTGGLCIAVIIHPGLTGLYELAPRGDADVEVKIHSAQWYFEVEYPNGEKSTAELVLPVGQKVRFEISANKVLHSMWIPAFRLKMDAVPGQVTELNVTPNQVGSYADNPMLRIQCAEICGLNHGMMQLPIRVVEQDEFYTTYGGN